jgi:copper resistance protein B
MKATYALLIAVPLIAGALSARAADVTTAANAPIASAANASAANASAANASAANASAANASAANASAANASAADASAADASAADASAADAMATHSGAHTNAQHPSNDMSDHSEMSYRQMADLMQMDDTSRFAKVMLEQLEWRNGGMNEGRAAWDAQAYYGGDYDKLWIKTEGKYVSQGRPGVHDADVEVLWDRVISTWWNVQAGARQDFGSGQSRTWAAIGIQGLAPQWFQTEASVFASDEGRTAARLKAQYELLLTQRLVLQPFAEANFYGHSDPAHEIGSGLSDLEISARLRYEVSRQFAPYVGVVWLRRFGGTADLVRAAGGEVSDLELTAGLRVWF